MKASNPLVMVQAYRLLSEEMYLKGWDYPLHLGVTEVAPAASKGLPYSHRHSTAWVSKNCASVRHSIAALICDTRLRLTDVIERQSSSPYRDNKFSEC